MLQQDMALPRHVGIIMDGNGRWAESQGLTRTQGHKQGALKAREIIVETRHLGIEYLTLYAFSKENWKRPKAEVSVIFDLFVEFLKKEEKTLVDNGMRFFLLGDKTGLPLVVRKIVEHIEKKTQKNTGTQLNLAINYSGRDDIVQALQSIVKSAIKPEDITETTIAEHLWTKNQPDPDLIIRTSGELRTSNFLVYQSAYSEYYFSKTLWPDFSVEEYHTALQEFGHRSRRYGDIQSS